MAEDVQRRNARRRARYAEDREYRERVRAANRARYASDPEVRERMLARSKRQREDQDPEVRRAYARRWAREVGGPRMNARRASDPDFARHVADRRREATYIRRARKRDVFVERVFRSVVWKRDAGVCGICGMPAASDSWHLDHIVPLSAGGPHSYDNVQVSHPICNLRKGARIEVQ